MNTERFILTRSAINWNGWLLADTQTGIRCSFETHKFNETQEFDGTGATTDAQALATIKIEMGDWVANNAYNIAMPMVDAQKYIGEQVRCARLAKGWSKYRLSKEAGISETHVEYMESGKHAQGVAVLHKIAVALGCSFVVE